MSKEEALRRAIEKAQASGYRPLMTVNQVIAHNNQFQNPIAIIFTHDFAKAFWGEKRYEHVDCGGVLDVLKEIKCPKCGHVEPPLKGCDGWLFHLQEMVISEDPLRCLEKFLDKK
jgi:hypothetical protein